MEALKTLSANKEINLKKGDKRTATVIMDTRQKIQEGLEQLSNENFYKPLETPIVSSTMAKVENIVRTLFDNGHIDNMTCKWLFFRPRAIANARILHAEQNTPKYSCSRPIVSSSSGPNDRIYSFVDSLLQPIAQKQESYIKDTTHFINFIENTLLLDGAVLATLDVCSLYTNIPQEGEIEVVCQYYQEHYQSKTPIPTQSLALGDLIRLILKENSFKFNDKHYLQTHGIAIGTKMAVAFAVIFITHIEKQPT